MTEETKNVVAINRKTGSEYIFCKKTDHGNYYQVSIASAFPVKWLVNENDVSFLPPTNLNQTNV